MMPLTHEDNAHGLGGGFHMFHIASLGSIAIFIAKLNSVVDKAMEATSPKRRGGRLQPTTVCTRIHAFLLCWQY